MKEKVLRQCVSCRQLKDRDEMLKITKVSDTGKIFLNPNSKVFGRSVYLCYNKSCINEALKKNKLEKCLRASLDEDFKAKIKEQTL